MALTVGQHKALELNKGKTVKVYLIGGEIRELTIQGAIDYTGEFRYIMHKAKNPRNPFIDDRLALHENIAHGYYYIDPMRIIL